MFTQFLNEGRYDIFHCHAEFAGYLNWHARRVGIPVRIAHSHTSRLGFWQDQYWGAFGLAQQITNRWFERTATHGLAVSRTAAEGLFGSNWRAKKRVQILPCGIDLRPFEQLPSRAEIRRELGIDTGAMVLGHVGRFSPEKNHLFLVDLLAAAVARNPAAHLLLVGDGTERARIEQRIREKNLAGHVTLAGYRSDAPRLFRAMNAFVMPSIYEGLPLVAVEAQAAGIPCLISTSVTDEVVVLPEAVSQLPLSAPLSEWVDGLFHLTERAPPIDALPRVVDSAFNVEQSTRRLGDFYHAAWSPTK